MALSREQADVVIRLAVDAGIERSFFDGWEKYELALYSTGERAPGRMADLVQASEERGPVGAWVLDIGVGAKALRRPSGQRLADGLHAAGIAFDTTPVSEPFLGRIQRSMRDHAQILAELAKQ